MLERDLLDQQITYLYSDRLYIPPPDWIGLKKCLMIFHDLPPKFGDL